MRTRRALFLGLVLALLGCGDDDGVTASDYEGLWLFTEIVVDDNGTPLTLRRDGDPLAIRGDAVFTATGAQTGTLDVRQVALSHGLLAGEVFADQLALTVESDRWILTDPDGEVIVLATALTDDHLVLTHDPSDPRDTAIDPPHAITIDRVAPWSTALVGGWDLVSITVDGNVIAADTCLEVQAGTTWAKITMLITIDGRGLFSRVMTTRTYANAGCTSMVAESTSTQTGYGEEEGPNLRMWAVEGADREFQAFTFVLDAATATLTRTSCLPTPDCLTSAPTTVVVRRRP